MGPLYVLLGEVSVQVLYSFLNWIVCHPGVELCEFFIYFGDQTPVWGIIGKCGFPYGWFPFYFLMFSSAMQKLFSLMYSHLFILSFISLALGNVTVMISLHGMSEIFLPMFSSRTFIVSWLMFKSFIHFEFILVYGGSQWSSFFFSFLAWTSPVLPTPFAEETIFTPFYVPVPFVKY